MSLLTFKGREGTWTGNMTWRDMTRDGNSAWEQRSSVIVTTWVYCIIYTVLYNALYRADKSWPNKFYIIIYNTCIYACLQHYWHYYCWWMLWYMLWFKVCISPSILRVCNCLSNCHILMAMNYCVIDHAAWFVEAIIAYLWLYFFGWLPCWGIKFNILMSMENGMHIIIISWACIHKPITCR